MYKGRITPSNGEVAIPRISDSKTYNVIHRIEIYPMDAVIQPSNNQGLYCSFYLSDPWTCRQGLIVYLREQIG